MIEFSEGYLQQLATLDGSQNEHVVSQLRDGSALRQAPLPAQQGEVIDYAVLTPVEESNRRILYQPGFTEGVIAKSSFAVAMVDRGFEFYLPDQNRTGTPRLKRGAFDAAALLQARNTLAIIENEGLEETRLDVVSHSFGFLVTDKMVKLAQKYDWTCFDDSTLVNLAPMTLDHQEGLQYYPSLLWRFITEQIAESKASGSFSDVDGLALKAGISSFMKNPVRSSMEVLRILGRRTDVIEMSSRVGSVALLGFEDDRLSSKRLLEPAFELLPDGVISAILPSSERYPALHSDDQSNPERVADAVSFVLSGNLSVTV